MIFLDTSYLVAYYNEDDQNHKKAIKLMELFFSGNYGEFIISDYVFDEFITVMFHKIKNIPSVVKVGNDVLFFTTYFSVTKDIFNISWKLFEVQQKTKFGFTDCTIVALMNDLAIKYLATFDQDFKKVEGIKILG